MEMHQNCMVPPGFYTDTASSPMQSMQERRKIACDPWNKCHRAWVLMVWYFLFVGGAFKVTFQSLVVLSLLTILIPYLYDVSADEKQQIRRQSLEERSILITEVSAWEAESSSEGPKHSCIWWPPTVINSPNGNSVSMISYIICRAQCKMKMPASLFKKLLKISRQWQQSIKPSMWPFWTRVLLCLQRYQAYEARPAFTIMLSMLLWKSGRHIYYTLESGTEI